MTKKKVTKKKVTKKIDTSLNDKIRMHVLRISWESAKVNTCLHCLAGDVDRYLQNLDNGDAMGAAYELENMQIRIKDLKDGLKS